MQRPLHKRGYNKLHSQALKGLAIPSLCCGFTNPLPKQKVQFVIHTTKERGGQYQNNYVFLGRIATNKTDRLYRYGMKAKKQLIFLSPAFGMSQKGRHNPKY